MSVWVQAECAALANKARERRHQLRLVKDRAAKEMDALDSLIAGLDSIHAQAATLEGEEQRLGPQTTPRTGTLPGKGGRRPGSYRRRTLQSQVLEAMREEEPGKVWTRHEVMRLTGCTVSSANTVLSVLAKGDRSPLIRAGQGRYTLRRALEAVA